MSGFPGDDSGFVAVVVEPAFCGEEHVEGVHQRFRLTQFEEVRARGSLVTLQVALGGDREGQEPARGEAIDESGEEIPLEVVHHQDQVPRSRRQGLGCEIGHDRVDADPSRFRSVTYDPDGNG